MNLKRSVLIACLCLLLAAVCHAEMTIWFQNGDSVRAYKIVFQGQNADIFLLDGSVRRVPVNQIDLHSSGIAKPEGTYGGKGPGPAHLPTATPPIPVNQAARQAQLKDEWERAERKATAQRDIGAIKRGDEVRIVAQTEEQATDVSPYAQPAPPQDNAYVILYRNPDGTYEKKLFDAATFADNFKLKEKPAPVVSMPMEPRIPESAPAVQGPQPQPGAELKTAPAPEAAPATPEKKPEPAAQAPPQQSRLLPVLLVILGIGVIAAAVVFLLSRKRKKALVDTSKFKQYEDELRDFEIEIWLKHGRTMDQLTDISIKKFYGDQPDAMAVVTKILKGVDKNGVVGFIAKLGALDTQAAGRIYVEMKQRLEWIRNTIELVSKRTGRQPLAEAEAAPAPTGIMPAPKPAPAAPSKPAAAPIASPPPAYPPPPVAPTGIMPIPKAAAPPAPPAAKRPASTTGEIPDYLNNVLPNLALLSGPTDEFES